MTTVGICAAPPCSAELVPEPSCSDRRPAAAPLDWRVSEATRTVFVPAGRSVTLDWSSSLPLCTSWLKITVEAALATPSTVVLSGGWDDLYFSSSLGTAWTRSGTMSLLASQLYMIISSSSSDAWLVMHVTSTSKAPYFY